jgi:enoyl-CoA hydratase
VIDVHHQGSVAILSMSHGKANAMDIEFCERISLCFEQFAVSPARAAVLTGHGKMFSAGVDLLRASDAGPDYFPKFLPALRKALEAVFFCAKPVVAAINGHAIAGGCILACAADRRLMARDGGRIGVTELLVGVPFPVIALEVMRFAATSHRFEDMVLGAATYPPDAARELGLVHDVVDGERLLEAAIAAAQKLGELAPVAFALTKRQTRQVVADRITADGPRYDAEVDRIWQAPQSLANIRSYVSRTFKKA